MWNVYVQDTTPDGSAVPGTDVAVALGLSREQALSVVELRLAHYRQVALNTYVRYSGQTPVSIARIVRRASLA